MVPVYTAGRLARAISSVEERLPYKQGVGGSNPPSPTTALHPSSASPSLSRLRLSFSVRLSLGPPPSSSPFSFLLVAPARCGIVARMDAVADDGHSRAGALAPADAQSYVRHELRTPLAVIQPLLEILLGGSSGSLDEKQLSYLQMLKRNVERLSAMITSLVETGWLEVAAIPQEARPVGAAEIVSDTVASVRAAFPEAPSIVVDLEERLPPVHGDAHRLRCALRNVLVNACTFASASERVDVRVGMAGHVGHVAIVVTDRGPGITAEDLPRVFDLGYRGAAACDRGTQGLGLGLPVTRALVEEAGGRVVLESALGRGTSVTLELPAASG